MTACKSVVIVDDEGDFAEGLAFLLGAEGYEASVVTSGHLLLEKLSSAKPDLILLDVMMPAYNGLEVMTAISGLPVHKKVPIILMSASKEPDESPKQWVDFISKPTDIEELLFKVKDVLK